MKGLFTSHLCALCLNIALIISPMSTKPTEEQSTNLPKVDSVNIKPLEGQITHQLQTTEGKSLSIPDEQVLVLSNLNKVEPREEVIQPRPTPANDTELVVTPAVPVKLNPAKNGNDEIMETAHTMVFMPLFAYRRLQSQRRRVYNPSRRYYRFPTIS